MVLVRDKIPTLFIQTLLSTNIIELLLRNDCNDRGVGEDEKT